MLNWVLPLILGSGNLVASGTPEEVAELDGEVFEEEIEKMKNSRLLSQAAFFLT